MKKCKIITKWMVEVAMAENPHKFHEQKLHPRALDRFYISCHQTARSLEVNDFDLELVLMVTSYQKNFDLLIQRCC